MDVGARHTRRARTGECRLHGSKKVVGMIQKEAADSLVAIDGEDSGAGAGAPGRQALFGFGRARLVASVARKEPKPVAKAVRDFHAITQRK